MKIWVTRLTALLLAAVLLSGCGKKPAVEPEDSTAAESTGTAESVPESTGMTESVPEDTQPTQTELPSEPAEETLPPVVEEDREDPQQSAGEETPDVDVADTIKNNSNETDEITLGIDVSKYQGTIDWEQVAAAGVDFAMIRVGYRAKVSGEITADANAKYNMQQAQKYGIKIGAYFFSCAITEAEAIEEAKWVAEQIAPYSITYPVAYNCEGFSDPENRQYSLTKSQRTDMALAFLRTIDEKGYTPMFYASKAELQGNAQWETSRIDGSYKIWVAQYPAEPYPQTSKSSYTGSHDMWQFTANGSVPGICVGVDVNVAYFGYEKTEKPKEETDQGEEKPDVDVLMNFREVHETVTAKIETNLRDIPSQGEDSRVLYKLKNGETATRVGISDSGWSKLNYNGTVCYAVSSYLTTDLTPAPTEDDEPQIKTRFTEVNEQVTAKDVVNLRTLPSVTDEGSQVVAQLKNGEVVTRTGINTDVGWSRVEYNGQVLYCVSSYLMPAEEEVPEETQGMEEPTV